MGVGGGEEGREIEHMSESTAFICWSVPQTVTMTGALPGQRQSWRWKG